MSCVEIYSKPNFGRRLRRIACAATTGMKRISGNFFSSLGTLVAPPWTAPTQTPVTGLPITGDASGTQTVTVDLEFHGHDIPAGGKTATITYNIGSGSATTTAALVDGDTPIQATIAIANAIDAVAGLSAVRGAGTAIRVTPDDTVDLSAISVAVA